MLKQINLASSLHCGANCIFCPSIRGKQIKPKFMTVEVAKRIVDEVASSDFKNNHCINKIGVSENGDAFLNKDIIEILRYIKLKLPDVTTEIYTNFQHFTKDKAEIILGEDLIRNFNCNVDSSNAQNYFTVKNINLQTVEKNLRDFLEVRRNMKSNATLSMQIITLRHYTIAIQKHFGFYPSKLKEHKRRKVNDDYAITVNYWKKLLDADLDKIFRPRVVAWAEREACDSDIDYKLYSCPNITRIKTEAFIAPDGTWYACCLDSNLEIVFGNILSDGISRVYSSVVRHRLIDSLEKKEFQEIGGPCKTVNCCQYLMVSDWHIDPVKYLAKQLFNAPHKRIYSVINKLKMKYLTSNLKKNM